MDTQKLALEALLGLKEFRPEEKIAVEREGAAFSFTLRALSEREMITCRERHTRGGKLNENMYHSALIYAATADESKNALWDRREAWGHFGALTGEDMVDKLLLAGEKRKALDAIARLSGYVKNGLEKEIKN